MGVFISDTNNPFRTSDRKIRKDCQIMKTLLLIFVLSVSLQLSSCLFFGPVPSSCRSDRECPRLTSSGGRCIDRGNIFCGLANIFRRNKENCGYKQCATCVNDVDCTGYRYCSGFFCNQRRSRYSSRNRDRYRG